MTTSPVFQLLENNFVSSIIALSREIELEISVKSLKIKRWGILAIYAISIVLIVGSPFLLIVLLVRNLLLKRKIRFEREHKGVESHG